MPGKTGEKDGGILERLSTLVEKLADLAEKGEGLQKTGELASSDEKVRGSYRVDVRVGPVAGEGEEPSEAAEVEPYEEGRGRRAAVQPIREPNVDVFDEATGLLVVGQLPGVSCRDIVLELRGDVLTIEAEHEDLRYHKELLLPRTYTKEQMDASCHNGVLEIRMVGDQGE